VRNPMYSEPCTVAALAARQSETQKVFGSVRTDQPYSNLASSRQLTN